MVFFLAGPWSMAQAPLSGAGMHPASTTSMASFDQTQVDAWMNDNDAENRRKTVENLFDSVSKLDLKAPGSARKEYEKGAKLLVQRSFADAAEHFASSLWPLSEQFCVRRWRSAEPRSRLLLLRHHPLRQTRPRPRANQLRTTTCRVCREWTWVTAR